MAENVNAVTVSQLNRYIKLRFDSDEKLSSVWVKGELSNFVHHRSGHFYMSLKDETSLIKAVMFASAASRIKFRPESGMKVICRGRVAVFERDGQYQLYIEEMIPDGVGSLYIAYEQLKKKLEAEGLFDASRKRRLPSIPLRIGVITSPTGAAVRDIINVCTRRFPLAKISLYPALVQGDGAPASLIEALRYFNSTQSADVIIIGRGGGSIEDLWGFNDEGVAREVAASKIPVISAVGHETDFTICDFAADMRAPTPSAGAELCVPDSTELLGKFGNLKHKITILAANAVKAKKQHITTLGNRPCLTSPKSYVEDKTLLLDNLTKRMDSAMTLAVQKKKTLLGSSAAKLDALSPLSILSRGYSYVTCGESIVKQAADVKEGDTLKVRFSDGVVEAQTKNVTVKEK